jgi:hypothetical protein
MSMASHHPPTVKQLPKQPLRCLPRGRQHDPRLVQAIVQLQKKSGATAYRIHKQTGLSPWTINRWLKRSKQRKAPPTITKRMPENITQGHHMDERTKHEICRRFAAHRGPVSTFVDGLRRNGVLSGSNGASYGTVLALLNRKGLREPLRRRVQGKTTVTRSAAKQGYLC